MNVQPNKITFKKLVGMAGVASFSVLLSIPGLAQLSPNANGQLLSQTMSENQQNRSCGGYEGNGTSGGGYYCATGQINRQFDNRMPQENRSMPQENRSMPQENRNLEVNPRSETSPPERSNTDNGGSTTGAGYPGNNVTPQGRDKDLNWEYSSPDSNSQYKTPGQGSSDGNKWIAPPGGTYNEMDGVFYQEGENLIVP